MNSVSLLNEIGNSRDEFITLDKKMISVASNPISGVLRRGP